MTQRVGVAAAGAVAVLCLCYAIVLALGLFTLPSPEQQIQEPWFTLMELLIILIAPAMVVFMLALYAWVSEQERAFAMGAVAFMSMCAALTSAVHFAVLTLSRQPAFSAHPWASEVFSFRWPSLAYALDILAWDLFFPIAALFAARSLRGVGLASAVRRLMYLSAALSFVGLAGVPLASMQVRNTGIVGYAVLFPIAAALMLPVFRRGRNASTG
jgi:hypothetical protein